MSVPKKSQRLSVAEYLEAEKDSPVRHEYVDGQIFAMAGASDRHNRIAGNSYSRLTRLIVEASSPGTERIDRSEKLPAYRQVKSLKEYVIVSQDRLHIEVFRRGRGDRWRWELLTEVSDDLRLESVGLTLTVAAVYRRVKFPQRALRR